jgi:putative transposase
LLPSLNLTRSAKGNGRITGRNVAQKAGLNREILATAPSAFLNLLRYKAAEAGIAYVEAPSRTVKPSQTCSGCGLQRKKPLSERQHVCTCCGLVLTRDQNAARVNLRWSLAHTGREPSGCLASIAS